MKPGHRQYMLLIYQLPSQPSAARVGVWRELKRLGALYLQQSACILPSTAPNRTQLRQIAERVGELGGAYHLLPLRALPEDEEEKIVQGFLAQSTLQYDEIIENCDVNFAKEIEFEIFRQNFTYAEAEEIRQDLDKIRRWYERVVERDWFSSERRAAAAQAIGRCETLLDGFEERVYEAQASVEGGGLVGPDESAPRHQKTPSAHPPRNRRMSRAQMRPAPTMSKVSSDVSPDSADARRREEALDSLGEAGEA